LGATLNDIDIETIKNITKITKPKMSTYSLGNHSLIQSPFMKNQLFQYMVTAEWTQGDSDYDSKEAKIDNIADSGLPVWFEATSWRKNAIIFGKIHDVEYSHDEGEVNVTKCKFVITGVFLWGYLFVQDNGLTGIKIYDLDKMVQSTTINPILRRCNFSKTSSQLSFSIFVKNTQGTSVAAVLEMMIPDAVIASSVTVSAPGAVTKLVGIVGSSGFSSTPGTKQRIKLSRTLSASAEEQWDVIISFNSNKTSYIDGSFDDIAA